MPIYEYRCESCEQTLEALQRMSDEPLKQCPSCGKETLSKMVSAASFRLKGGGWYETDFKTGKKKQLADSSSSSSTSSGSGTETGSTTSTPKAAS
ncbi:MAG: zinc ribbon domain-containing protein [Proteobacteria bacterium]|jgi:putative FmdB family regulatory protein|nr:zinc ribbon domain-containing protein [Pseudomonadales bacterium]MDA0805275.1 zinc ribbon domain-containing protein [Pseudomonadota bacterium]MDA0895366.1 zinc ribbon domain-containing protein [Pseudomonadota bacterium]MDA1244194.1 zinc ribbon domain-containing protein [Pseudomonadota bacterium]